LFCGSSLSGTETIFANVGYRRRILGGFELNHGVSDLRRNIVSAGRVVHDLRYTFRLSFGG